MPFNINYRLTYHLHVCIVLVSSLLFNDCIECVDLRLAYVSPNNHEPAEVGRMQCQGVQALCGLLPSLIANSSPRNHILILSSNLCYECGALHSSQMSYIPILNMPVLQCTLSLVSYIHALS